MTHATYQLLFAVFIAGAIVASVRNPARVLLFIAFSFPFRSLYVTPGGVYLEIWKVLALLLLPVTLARLTPARLRGYSALSFFLLYAIAITLIFGFLGDTYAGDAEGLRGVLRPIAQVGQLLAFVSVTLSFRVLTDGEVTATRCLRAFVLGAAVSCGVAVLQWLAFQLFAFNLFPIPRLTGELQADVVVFAQLGEHRRLTALSMEPKNLAINVVFMIAFLCEARLFRAPLFDRGRDVLLIALGVAVTYATYSTLGYVTLVLYVGFVAFRIAGTLLGASRRRRVSRLLLPGFAIVLMIGIARRDEQLSDLLRARTFDRLWKADQGLLLEDFDEAASRFLIAEPEYVLTGVGFGNVHRFASDYLPNYALAHASNSAWAPKSGLLYMLCGAGLIGTLCIVVFVTRATRAARAPGSPPFLATLLMFVAGLTLLRFDVMVFFLLGLVSFGPRMRGSTVP